MTIEQLKALNEMIKACIENGGDAGGSYNSCPDKCKARINEFLILMGEQYLYVSEDKSNFNWPCVTKTNVEQSTEIWEKDF